ncbi:MAG: extracellular solute-binding protein [Patescibacteria group bacterium]|jgi:ABC-type glycerol-3-phosphate transport system substrate-binding protein
MQKKLPALLCLVCISVLLSACTIQDLPLVGKYLGGKGPALGPVSLTMWGMWEDPSVMQKLIEKYQIEHPNVSITYEDRSVVKPLVTYKERVFSRLGTEESADIVMVHNSWVPYITNSLSPAPASVMSADDFASNFYPAANDTCVVGGKVYSIPYYYDGLVLIYNRDHFESVGQEEPPTAWEEFRKLALDLTKRSDDGALIRAGAAMGTATNIDHFSDILGMMFAQAGAAIPEDLDSEKAMHALSFYTNFVKEDRVWDASLPEAVDAFANGKVSMIFAPSWRILDIKRAAPTLNIGVAPVPQAVPSEPATWGSFWTPVVSSNSQNASTAWDFINFLAQDEQQLMLFDEASKLREFGTPYSRISLAAELLLNPYLSPVLSTAGYSKSGIISARSGNQRQETAMKEAVNSVLKGIQPLEALKTAKTAISQ